jgi:hypothetical protein
LAAANDTTLEAAEKRKMGGREGELQVPRRTTWSASGPSGGSG